MRGALPHALLLHGPAGTGKPALAEAFASALLCERPAGSGAACGGCEACAWMAQDNHPDVRRLAPGADEEGEAKEKASREIRIGQVRALSGFLSVGAHRGGRKVVVVDPADALNTPAANALLKTLEEPPGDTVFLLVTDRADGLPATIRSRCVAVSVGMPPLATARDWLMRQSEVAAATGPERDVEGWLAAAGGAPLRALELAEPAASAALRQVVDAIAALPEGSPLAAAESLAGIPPRDWLPVFQGWLADLGRVLADAQPRRHPGRAARLAAVAASTSPQALGGFDAWLQSQRPLTGHPLNARLFCEDVMLRYAAAFRSNPPPRR